MCFQDTPESRHRLGFSQICRQVDPKFWSSRQERWITNALPGTWNEEPGGIWWRSKSLPAFRVYLSLCKETKSTKCDGAAPIMHLKTSRMILNTIFSLQEASGVIKANRPKARPVHKQRLAKQPYFGVVVAAWNPQNAHYTKVNWHRMQDRTKARQALWQASWVMNWRICQKFLVWWLTILQIILPMWFDI